MFFGRRESLGTRFVISWDSFWDSFFYTNWCRLKSLCSLFVIKFDRYSIKESPNTLLGILVIYNFSTKKTLSIGNCKFLTYSYVHPLYSFWECSVIIYLIKEMFYVIWPSWVSRYSFCQFLGLLLIFFFLYKFVQIKKPLFLGSYLVRSVLNFGIS